LGERVVTINGRFLTQPFSGVQRYAGEIVLALDELLAVGGLAGADGVRFRLVAPLGAEPPGPLRRIAFEGVGKPAGHRWDQVALARAARGGPLLSLGGSGPLFHRDHLVVIHDAAVYRHPEHFSRAYGLLHRTLGRVFARTARLATVSEFSRRELAALLGRPETDINVAPNGWEHLARITPEPGVAARYVGAAPFFVTVGNLTPNKNLAVAVRAFGLLPRGTAKLVVVGSANASIFGAGKVGLENPDVVFAGRLGDEALAGLLRESRALIFPSIYEGFGIPPLEAMQAGTRILASRAEAIVEVCDGVADFFEAHDAETLASLIAQVLRESPETRDARIAAGRARLDRYSWSRSAAILGTALLSRSVTARG
jgi:glycosyltransferase involved in cell wall biosynthesis